MSRYNGVHRQQLFHWIGSHIDAGIEDPKKTLTPERRNQYIECLKGALNSGLWVKKPHDPDFLGDGDLIRVNRPIVCFTEWSLDESLPHTSRYGRMGLGFSKKFVLRRGGQPVTYIRDNGRLDPYTKALNKIAGQLSTLSPSSTLTQVQLNELREHFDYLAHFNKKIKRAPSARSTAAGLTPSASTPRSQPTPDPFKRLYGPLLHFLEEKEWRIVYHRSLGQYFADVPAGQTVPERFLKFTPGNDLFTLVLPDNATVNMAIHDQEIREMLFPTAAPHVTVLSLQDVGTF